MKTSFDTMLNNAKNKNYLRDRRRSEELCEDDRYECVAFPAYHGSPITTNSVVLAYIILIVRSFYYAESRIIDRVTGKHHVL